ncbi:MAG: hypothetical protein KatS3mg095_0783 [Candidatus Parcubacteria bacterium]|nr:MAG: hypothetical protein KatS3mg095_0783 [Candidatus Parcubacteria bacterium]
MKKYLILFLIIFPNLIFAANIYFSPAKGEFEINKDFKLVVYVDSDQDINAIGSKINFDKDYLSVVNINDNGSIINFWAVKPNFDNLKGEIVFEGVSLNKSFKGNKGRVLEIEFKPKKEIGETKLYFNNVQILAADGNGTNIFDKANEAIIKIFKKEIKKEIASSQKNYTLPKPVIISKSHPNQDQWSKNNNLDLEWKVPDNVNRIRLILSTNPNQQPNIIYEPPINSRKINNLSDGIYYFKLQFENNEAVSEISVYKIMIDITPPVVEIKELPRKFIYESPKFEILTEDNLSGINYFDIYIDNKLVATTNERIISLDNFDIKPGKHNFIVRVFDNALNSNQRSIDFEIGTKDILTEKKINEIKINIVHLIGIILVMIFILITLIILILILYFKNKKLRKQIEDKIFHIEDLSHRSFIALKHDLEKQLNILESIKKKRELIEEEKEQIEHLKKHIKYINKVIEKNLKDIDSLLK